ncbi:MAG: GNAT family N-acetyltransferase [Actinomycetota bacterium]
MGGSLTVRDLEVGEERAWAHAVLRHFHEDGSEAAVEPWIPIVADRQRYRAWAVRDGGSIVANAGVLPMTVSLPGGASLPCAGVTAVGVAQTHRRRGLLRRLMATALDDAVGRGEPVALLFASESAIYGRFGFGATAPQVRYRLDRPTAWRDPVDARLVAAATPEEALAQWPAILASLRAQRGGVADRSEGMWRLAVAEDPEAWRGGASARRLVHVPGRGYATYRVKAAVTDGLPAGEVRVNELVATDPEAEAALWQHVGDVDLSTTVVAGGRPPDEALPALLVDPLRARTAVDGPLYARLLDVPAALAARAYATTDALTLAIADADRDQSGTYRLEAGPDGAEVTVVDADPDLSLPVDVAAAVWLGGVRATQLRDARALVEHRPGAAARLDRLVAVERLPWTPFEF